MPKNWADGTKKFSREILVGEDRDSAHYIGAIDANSITVVDQATKEEFELKIGGPGRTVTALGATITVTLEKVDTAADPPEATVKASTGDTRVLKLQ